MAKKERLQDNFIKLYRDIIYAIGLDNAIVLGQLIGCEEMFNEWFFQTNAQIMFYTGLGKLKVRKALIELEQCELINVKRHTQNNKNVYSINHYNVELIHYIDKKCNDDKTKVKGKYIRTELQQNWWYDFHKNGLNAIDMKLIDEMHLNKHNEQVDLGKLVSRYKEFKLFADDDLNRDLRDFFKKLKNTEKKEILEYLYVNSPVALCLSTYISVFKIMHKELVLKIPKDYNSSKNLLKNIKEMLEIANMYYSFDSFETYCNVYFKCWQWLLGKGNEMLKGLINKDKPIKIDYSIFLYTNRPNWKENFESTNWFAIAFENVMPDLYKEKNKTR